jgi:penicillin-binding protein 1C
MLYAGIARQGTVLPLRERLTSTSFGTEGREGTRLMGPVAAWYVSNVLIGTPPPENGLPGRIAFKTGTSYGYRDAWSIGFDGTRTIGIWVGRPDGAPVPRLVGRNAAAPILFDAFARLQSVPTPLPRAPDGVVMTTSARLPPPLKHFAPGDHAGEAALNRLHILFPPDGARLELIAADDKLNPVPLKVTGAIAPLTVLVNGVPARARPRGMLFFQPDGPGFVRVTVIDGAGATDSIVVRLDDSSPAGVAAVRSDCPIAPCSHP